MLPFLDVTPLEMVQACLTALGAGVLVSAIGRGLADRYEVLILPSAGGRPLRMRVRVFRPWFAPGRIVYHPDHGRCEVARQDRTPDLGITWVCLYPLDEYREDEDGPPLVPGAQWAPISEIGETPEEAAELPDEPESGGGSW